MNHDLEGLKGERPATLPQGIRERLNDRVAPVMAHRRRLRRQKTTGAALVLLAGVIGLWLHFEPRIDAARLRRKSDSELIAAWNARRAAGPRMAGSLAAFPFASIVRSADCVVQGTVIDIVPDRDALIRFLSFSPHEAPIEGADEIKWNLKIKVERSIPPIKEDTIEVAVFADPGWIQTGQRYLCALKRTDQGYSMAERELHMVRPQGTVDAGSVDLTLNDDARMSLSLDQAWSFVEDVLARSQGDSLPDERLQGLLKVIDSGTSQEASFALETMTTIGADGKIAQTLAESLQRRYYALMTDSRTQAAKRRWSQPWKASDPRDFQNFALLAMNAVSKSGDAASAEKILALYGADMQTFEGRVFDFNENTEFPDAIIGVALAIPPLGRREVILALASRTFNYVKDDGVGNRVDGYVPTPIGYSALVRIAKTPGDDIEGILSTLLADPVKYHLASYMTNMEQVRRDLTSEANRAKSAMKSP